VLVRAAVRPRRRRQAHPGREPKRNVRQEAAILVAHASGLPVACHEFSDGDGERRAV